MRGFLGGVSVGALLAAGGLAMLSLSVPLPQMAAKPEQAPEPAEETAGGTSEPAENTGSTELEAVSHDPGDAPQMPNGGSGEADVPGNGQGRDADLAEVQPEVPISGTAQDDLSALAGADTAPAQKPAVGLSTSAEGSESLALAEAPVTAETASVPQPQAVLPAVPEAPRSESAVVAATEPAPEPEGNGETVVTATIGAQEPETAPKTVGAPDTRTVQTPDIGSAPQATTLPVISAAPAVPDASENGSGAAEPGANEPEAAAEAAEPASLTPSIGTPVVPLTERDEQEAVSAAGGPDATPFSANSEPFFNPEDRPLMSIVLIDDAGAVGSEALAEFPYPLSFAIDPEDPEAAGKMAARRAAGFEVLMLADLPREASPQDAETAFEVWRSKLPEAMAILEGVETGVQGNRALADQVAAYAAAAGYGLLTQDSGLNTVQKLALRDGVPAGVVFRDFDGAGQDPRAIRRFLDQAAFRAGQEGAVIMLGRLRPDTISALLLWGLQDRAERVALAPVSASLESLLPGK
ncbi:MULTISPECIES: divergent polysaccharide deacteylase family protein [unclassified Leisingera]|uniref:divergent polysaccharide deacteylase family protein n=1 Tax=unclassified Leisingera TaxID=2614906 RepID=UPI000314F8F6|nr:MULTISPECIES: divergent polysaccharide deacetylase family protein [unclassified Leisingera]KIC25266.1 polysaccharide deacetylase [Leisingera sp. ANG-S3]KIC54682.1 polysaccharide deacetylase [Leisingera sp. ANG-S]KID10552.1 polysaccharide deacetylase [Leisingera sp. ANG1]